MIFILSNDVEEVNDHSHSSSSSSCPSSSSKSVYFPSFLHSLISSSSPPLPLTLFFCLSSSSPLLILTPPHPFSFFTYIVSSLLPSFYPSFPSSSPFFISLFLLSPPTSTLFFHPRHHLPFSFLLLFFICFLPLFSSPPLSIPSPPQPYL